MRHFVPPLYRPRPVTSSPTPPPPFFPTDIPTLDLFYYTGSGVHTSGSNVTQWDNLGLKGSAQNLIETNPINAPTYNATDVNFNNQSSINFTISAGNPQFLRTVGYTGTTAMHMFVVGKKNADPSSSGAKSGFLRISGNASSLCNFNWTDGVIYDGTGRSSGYVTVGNPTPSLTSVYLYEVYSSASTWYARVNTSTIKTTTAAYSFPSAAQNIDVGISPASYAYDGQFVAIGVSSAEITGTNYTNLIAWINTTYGTSF